jgi:Na+-translocating ferredoxin:NAD+ oxidoreductase RNF subunit RnfB
MEFIDSAVSVLHTAVGLINVLIQIVAPHVTPVVEAGSEGGAVAAGGIAVSKLLSSALIFLAGIALVFGVTLALIAKHFHTKSDPKVEQVDELLAHAHCGACGFPGCHQYAEAVVNKPEVSPSLCTPAGKEAAAKIAALVGKEMGEAEPKVAFVACRGDSEMSKKKFEHRGVPDCVAAAAVGGGDKECPFGCLGYGTCQAACPFDAIHTHENGLADVDPEKCVACGLCVKACPRKIISIVPKNKKPIVKCYSNDKGPAVKRYCKAGCIGCGLCVKNCPSQAIEMTKNLAKIDNKKCTDCGICETKCPTKAIQRMELKA